VSSNISLICIRNIGDKSDENIIDPLFTEHSVMAERARQLFNEKESNRIQSSNSCPLKAFVLPTSLVRINSIDNEIQTGILTSTDITISISNNDVSFDSQINVERLSS